LSTFSVFIFTGFSFMNWLKSSAYFSIDWSFFLLIDFLINLQSSYTHILDLWTLLCCIHCKHLQLLCEVPWQWCIVRKWLRDAISWHHFILCFRKSIQFLNKIIKTFKHYPLYFFWQYKTNIFCYVSSHLKMDSFYLNVYILTFWALLHT
jgi:hypothetical protein